MTCLNEKNTIILVSTLKHPKCMHANVMCVYVSYPDSHSRYGVFCLFKMGNQVMDSPSLVEVERTTMDIIFRDIILL